MCIPWALVGLLAAGCGGPRANVQAQNVTLQAKVNDLRARARRDRAKIRDLENQVFLLEDKVDTVAVNSGTADELRLPVEVLEPDADAGQTGYEVVGLDQDGNEIVYVGEAARDHSVSPRLRRYGNESHGRQRRSRASAPPVVLDLPRPGVDDRIPVTDSVPTIDNQLAGVRRARAAKTSARKLYQRHYASLRAGKHASAITGFRAFVQSYPAHDYADNAQYWLGEAHYDQKQFKSAMREFRRVVKLYPRGNKVSDALLKIGYCYAALGEQAKARDVLEQVTRVYPTSNSAKLAKRILVQLGGQEKP